MPTEIDMDALRDTLASEEAMVAYYGRDAERAAQNAALVAAGLKPLHSESLFQWNRDQGAKKARNVAALKAVIAHFEEGAA